MHKHLTVRMAWHDNNWDGKVCQNPEENIYCVGRHSLLSERLSRRRILSTESSNAGKRLDKLGDYIPPCFWTSNAFSNQSVNVRHDHPFLQYENTHQVHEKLSSYSVFTWPFKLSFSNSRVDGSYPPDLEDRIDRFMSKFTPQESIVFFYLNYDNPISADENKYVLVGCSTLAGIKKSEHFDFGSELSKIRKGPGMKNFPTLNWALNVSYNFEDEGILLPYKEYLDHIKDNPDDKYMLDEMRVVIDEDGMIPNFKYVAIDMDDDSCIYLLTKMKNSLTKIKNHAILNPARTQKYMRVIETLLERTWKLRGTHPGLGNVLDVAMQLNEEDYGTGDEIVRLVARHNGAKHVMPEIFSILSGDSEIPDYLDGYCGNLMEEAKSQRMKWGVGLLQKLSLFSLTHGQIINILEETTGCLGQITEINKIESNPYLLCEEYNPTEQTHTDDGVSSWDKKIGTFVIDVGMFPDPKFLRRNSKLQNLRPDSPERLRAIIIDHLKSLEGRGDCYSSLTEIVKHIQQHPLFYKEKISVSANDMVFNTGEYTEHFCKRLHISNGTDGVHYVYLLEIYQAEREIEKFIRTLLERPNYDTANDIQGANKDINESAKMLKTKIRNFPVDEFVSERKQLFEGAVSKSLYVISGRPGSGKTRALKTVIDALRNRGEKLMLLAPTGKASLRLKEATGHDSMTIDRLINQYGYRGMLVDLRNTKCESQKTLDVENIIIDESSMVDLTKLTVLFRMLTSKSRIVAKRILFVGDENQLPPIGYGRPFYDLIMMMKSNPRYRDANMIWLSTNCRQRFDSTVTDVAEIFQRDNKNYEEILSRIEMGKFSSSGFKVRIWENKTKLYSMLDKEIARVAKEVQGAGTFPAEMDKQLNLLLGLTESGHASGQKSDTMKLDRFQILSPYNGEYFGTLGLNEYIGTQYRKNRHPAESSIWGKTIPFLHSDKIICIKNQYSYGYGRKMVLSNGSIGVVNIVYDKYPKRIFLFADSQEPLTKLPGNLDHYDLAYAITVHKSQGSEFSHTFIVIPEKRAILSRELVYTALTRSTGKVTLFLQNVGGVRNNARVANAGILEYARSRSDIQPRLTSIFEAPEDRRNMYQPEKGKFVRSKAEYIIFTELRKREAKFEYERPCDLELKDGRKIPFKPDFTIWTKDGREYYLEHLGMLDRKDYADCWRSRRKCYERTGLADMLITTDDRNGIDAENIGRILNDLESGRLEATMEPSLHHYALQG